MDSQFYIHLPSDSSLGVYPDNTIARYSTKLSKTIDLDGQYEVGLSEIIYPTNYFNFDNREKEYKFWIQTVVKTVNPETREEEVVDNIRKRRLVRNGNFKSLDDFLTTFNRQIAEEMTEIELPSSCIKFAKSDEDRIVLVVNTPRDRPILGGIYFAMSPKLSRRLGYEDQIEPTSLSVNQRLRAKNSFELNMGKTIMYIYSDVISHSLVGDVSAPLLRACNLPLLPHDNSIHLTFPDIHYKPLQKLDFDTIDISINTEEGLPMPFQSGKVLITLHFRRIHNLSLR